MGVEMLEGRQSNMQVTEQAWSDEC
jgi:hypothetical protein